MKPEEINVASDKPTRPFLCSYYHEGANWSFTIHAYDFEDAKARVARLTWAKLDGELMATVPAKCGWLVKITCAIRNFFSKWVETKGEGE
jgi:hypothetical protein